MIALGLTGRRGACSFRLELKTQPTGITAICGPSGAGKTTLLLAIAGFVRLKGQVQFGDHQWQGDGVFVRPELRRIGMVFQYPSLFTHLSLSENLIYGLRRQGQTDPALIDRLVTHYGLTSLMKRPLDQLSGGEQRRLELARLAAMQPDLILLDEPFVHLDPEARHSVRPHIAELSRTRPVLMTAHSPADWFGLEVTALHMDRGQLSLMPPPPDIDSLGAEALRSLANQALSLGLRPGDDPSPE